MFKTIWQYQINLAFTKDFTENYKTDGNWAQLFKKSPNYLKTDFFKLEDKEDIFLTIDYWQNENSFKVFKINFKLEYDLLDKKCEKFTLEEIKLL
jgi:hypothetical protein